MIRYIDELPLEKKRVLLRVDYNVPLDGGGEVTDTTRIEATLPTIRYLLDKGCQVVIMSHMGRPKGVRVPELSLQPCAHILSSLLNQEVQFLPNCTGVKREVEQGGTVVLLENLRFHRAEEHPDDDPSFAQELATYGEVYLNDAFATAHRKHSSTFTICRHFGNKGGGFLLKKEVAFLGKLLDKPERPFHAVIGGAKISTKLGVLRSLIEHVDALLIGGAMAYTFLGSLTISTGNSPIEPDLFPIAQEIINACEKNGVELLLPIDLKIAENCSENIPFRVIPVAEGIPDGYEGLDIGPVTADLFSHTLEHAHTVLWNGPLGVFEIPPFDEGTLNIAHTLGTMEACTSVVGGGDSIAALGKSGMKEHISHISTGGGATLEFLEYGTLPGIEVLKESKNLSLK